MKKLSFLLLCTALFLFSCGPQKTDTKSIETTQSGTEKVSKGIAGTYSTVENGNPMQFVFNTDGTGYENYQGREKRPFTWKSKDDGFYFLYEDQTVEWKIPIDMVKETITYGALVYKKE